LWLGLAGLLKAREEEVGSLRGEKAGLQREVDRLGRENRDLRDQLADLQEELSRQAAGMEQAE
jgi:predicted nuclease with TOPRIM domain